MTEDCGIAYWKAMARKHEARAKESHKRAEFLLQELGKAYARMKALEQAFDIVSERERLRLNGVSRPVAGQPADAETPGR